MDLVEKQYSLRKSPFFNFTETKQSGKVVLEVSNLSKSYDKDQVLNNISFTVHRGDKIAIIGPNVLFFFDEYLLIFFLKKGIGKSTLLKIILNKTGLDSGEFKWGSEVDVSYFS